MCSYCSIDFPDFIISLWPHLPSLLCWLSGRIFWEWRAGRLLKAELNTRVWRTGTGNSRFFGGIGTDIGQNWYREKFWNRYRKDLVPGKSLGTGIRKIWYLDWFLSPKFRNFDKFKWVPVLGIFHFSGGIGKIWYRKSLGTGIGQIWFWKKVSEPVSEKFGAEKSTGIGIV